MIYLGLDISTSCIGMALLNENKELLKETCLRLDKAPYKTYSFYEKLEAFRGFLLEFVEGCKVDCAVVEQALGMKLAYQQPAPPLGNRQLGSADARQIRDGHRPPTPGSALSAKV